MKIARRLERWLWSDRSEPFFRVLFTAFAVALVTYLFWEGLP